MCGGLVDATSPIAPSFRHRFLDFVDITDHQLQGLSILAEEFRDYFKDGNYSNLLKFEEDIASTCSVVLIFLESPGSLVELGMFCNHPEYYKKLLIVATEEHTENGDSFIYLGPLEFIRSKDDNSVAIYPWPSEEKKEYHETHLEDLADVVTEKISDLHSEEKFDSNNHGHIAFLICEIIRVCFPIAKGEIAEALDNLGLTETVVSRYIYLLERLQYIGVVERSTSKFYFPKSISENKVQFGRSKNFRQIESQILQISFRQLIASSRGDPTSRRRANVLQEIMNHGGENES